MERLNAAIRRVCEDKMEDSIRRLRAMSFAERGELLASACRTAAALEQSRTANGFAPTEPAPWPESVKALMAAWAKAVEPRAPER